MPGKKSNSNRKLPGTKSKKVSKTAKKGKTVPKGKRAKSTKSPIKKGIAKGARLTQKMGKRKKY